MLLVFDMLDTLITSKTRIKLLLKFFLNSRTRDYLRGLEAEIGGSSNSIRLELNKFEQAGLLKASTTGNRKVFEANTEHPFYSEINSLLRKYIGIDKIIDQVISKLGDLQSVYLTGDLARGSDSNIMDLIFVGDIDRSYLVDLIDKAERLIQRKIRYVIYSSAERDEVRQRMEDELALLIWGN